MPSDRLNGLVFYHTLTATFSSKASIILVRLLEFKEVTFFFRNEPGLIRDYSLPKKQITRYSLLENTFMIDFTNIKVYEFVYYCI